MQTYFYLSLMCYFVMYDYSEIQIFEWSFFLSLFFFQSSDEPVEHMVVTDLTLTSYGSIHSDLSDGVPLWRMAYSPTPWLAVQHATQLQTCTVTVLVAYSADP